MKKELLDTLYWGKTQIAEFTGLSYNTASGVLEKARKKCESEGKMNPYKNKVYNGYVIDLLGIQTERGTT